MDSTADANLSAAEIRDLRDVAGTMIPQDTALGMPGADDPAIQADIVTSLGRDLPLVRDALAAIAERARDAFAGMDRDAREALINDYAASGGAAAATLGRVIVGAYYRDDRVLAALGHGGARAVSEGLHVEQGDWSLLEAVRGRAPFWRDDRTAGSGER